MKPKINSRDKGARFERKIANILKARGFEARRGNQFNGAFDADVESPVFPYHVECKHVQALNLYAAYEQSLRDAKLRKKLPMVIHTKNNRPTLATITLMDFLDLVQWALGRTDDLNSLDLGKFRNMFKNVIFPCDIEVDGSNDDGELL